MNEHGRKQSFLFEDIELTDTRTGLNILSKTMMRLWADKGFIDEIKNLPGVSAAYYGQSGEGIYELFFDPRYDLEFVKQEIEAIIMCKEA